MTLKQERLNYTLPYMLKLELEEEIRELAMNKRGILASLSSIEIPKSEKRKINQWKLKDLEELTPKKVQDIFSKFEELVPQDQDSGLLGKLGIGSKVGKLEYIKLYFLTTLPPTFEGVLRRAIDASFLSELPAKLENGEETTIEYVQKHFFFPKTGESYLTKYLEKTEEWRREILETLKEKIISSQREEKQLKRRIANLRHKLKEEQRHPARDVSGKMKKDSAIERRLEKTEQIKRKISKTEKSLDETVEQKQNLQALKKKVEKLKDKSIPPFETLKELTTLEEVHPYNSPMTQKYIAKVVLEVGIGKTEISPHLRSWVEEKTYISIRQTRRVLRASGKHIDLSSEKKEEKVRKEKVANKYTLKPWVSLGNIDISLLEKKREKIEKNITDKKTTLQEVKKKKSASHFLEVKNEFWKKLGDYENAKSLTQRWKEISEQRASSPHPYEIKEKPLFPQELDEKFTRAYKEFIKGHPTRKYDKLELEKAIFTIWRIKAELNELKEKKKRLESLLASPPPRIKHISKREETEKKESKTENKDPKDMRSLPYFY